MDIHRRTEHRELANDWLFGQVSSQHQQNHNFQASFFSNMLSISKRSREAKIFGLFNYESRLIF